MRRFLHIPWLLAWLVGATAIAGELSSDSDAFRIGVSRASFGTVHRNDANAALRAWADTVIREAQLALRAHVEIIESPADWQRAISGTSLHAFSSTTEEFLQSGEKPEFVFLNAKGADSTRQYVIITHRDGGAENVAALRGRGLVRHVSPTMSPAMAWLEVFLADHKLGRAAEFFDELKELESAPKCVLRVFFQQSEACLVATEGYEVACEMNPLLGRQLRVIASSPPLIPTLMYFRNSYTAAERSRIEATIVNLHSTKGGQQLLTVSQSTRMERHPVAVLDTTRELLERYARLTGPAPSGPPEPPRGESRIQADGGLPLSRETFQIEPGVSREPSSAALPKP